MNTKTCSDCKEEKDLSQFYSGHAWRTLKYGHDRLCKSCRNEPRKINKINEKPRIS